MCSRSKKPFICCLVQNLQMKGTGKNLKIDERDLSLLLNYQHLICVVSEFWMTSGREMFSFIKSLDLIIDVNQGYIQRS